MKLKFLILLFFPIKLLCQNTIGLPAITNFSKQTIKGGLQTWDIKQAEDGVVYFANNEGLISYNGKYWHTHSLPNKTILRSIEIVKGNKIYAGGQDELGYFEPEKNGNLEFVSLTSSLKNADKNFGDVWDIVVANNSIFFRTDSKIFKYTNNQFQVFTTKSKWLFLGVLNDKVFAQEENNGLLFFENNSWNPTNYIPLNTSPITALFSLENNTTIITSLKDGIFAKPANQSICLKLNNNIWQNEQIYYAQKINNKTFALATSQNGLFISDVDGNIVQKISKTEGLQSNNILSLLYDKQGNIWLGLNNGIDMVAFNSAIKLINPLFEDAAGYAALLHNNNLYLGTSNNLYSIPLEDKEDISFSKGIFTTIANAKGQNWVLNSINTKVLLGHHEGAFIVENNIAKQISQQNGFWNFIPLNSVFPSNTIIAGNYNGVEIFSYKNNSFVKDNVIKNFNESSRYITTDDKKNIWISHPYHGVFKISNYLDSNKAIVESYNKKNGLPSNLNNHVFNIKNEIIVATENGLYYYNEQSNKFEIQKNYYNILGNLGIRYLKEDSEGNIWFVSEKKLGVIDYSHHNEPKIIFITELERKILSGFENVYPINKNNILIAGEKGFYLINYEKYKQQIDKPIVQIRLVAISGNIDTNLFSGYSNVINKNDNQTNSNVPKISYGWSSLHFEFTSTSSFNNANLVYSYRLKGFDDKWSEWSNNTEKEYTNLSEGNYLFEVKVKNNLDIESYVTSYSFSILPPWYKSSIMKFLYFLVLIALIYFLYKRQKIKFAQQQKKHEEEQQKLQYIHELEINKTEAELVAVQNEKLAQEIEFKNSELASSAMHLVQKAEILATVKTSLNQISKTYGNVQAATEIKKLLRSLGDDENIDKEWESFSKHFNSVNNDFLNTLKEKHSNLSPNDLKLCAYLYMNLSTKEIAQLLNITVRGVEISRYRLRKKLGLTTEVSLVDYMKSGIPYKRI